MFQFFKALYGLGKLGKFKIDSIDTFRTVLTKQSKFLNDSYIVLQNLLAVGVLLVRQHHRPLEPIYQA